MQIFAAWFSFKGAIELAAILTENEEDHIKVCMCNNITQSHCFPFSIFNWSDEHLSKWAWIWYSLLTCFNYALGERVNWTSGNYCSMYLCTENPGIFFPAVYIISFGSCNFASPVCKIAMSGNAHCAHWDTPLSFYPFCYFYLSQVKWDFLKQTEITICAPIFHLVPSFERERESSGNNFIYLFRTRKARAYFNCRFFY